MQNANFEKASPWSGKRLRSGVESLLPQSFLNFCKELKIRFKKKVLYSCLLCDTEM